MLKIIAVNHFSEKTQLPVIQEISWEEYQRSALDIEQIAPYIAHVVWTALVEEFPLAKKPEVILELYTQITFSERVTPEETTKKLFQVLYQVYARMLFSQIDEYYQGVYQKRTELISDLASRCQDTALTMFEKKFTDTFYCLYRDQVQSLLG